MKKCNKTNKKGFTMVEVLIVVAIIAVLAVTIIPMISKYMQQGKDDYNQKLKNQLLVSGKEYYTNNKDKLPVKNYLGVYKDGKDYSYISLPEMQSENYISKDFVDSDGRECSKSYVYVRQNTYNNEYDWHACLKCTDKDGKDVNYSKDDAACNISNWGDTSRPTCSTNALFNTDVRIYNDKVFNPTSVKIQDIVEKYSDTNPNGKLAYISIENATTGDRIYVKAKEDIIANENINLIDYVKNKMGNKDGEYKVSLFDTGGNFSDICASFIIDNTIPTCVFNLYQDNITKKLTLTGKDALTKVEDLSKLIGTKRGLAKTYVEGKGVGYTEVSKNLKGTKDQKYYGYVMDEAGNMKTCSKDVKIQMFDGEKPYCTITRDNDQNYYSVEGHWKEKNLKVECYVAGGTNSTIDKTKIVASKGLGTLTVTENKTGNTNQDNKVMFDVVFKPINGKYGNETVIVNPGLVKDKAGTTNDLVDSSIIKVDAVAPTITYTPLTTKESGGWYKAPFKLKMQCTDVGGSKVSKFTVTVDGKTIENPNTITRSTAANPGTWKTSCSDGAENSSSASKSYFVRVYSANKVCGVNQYKSCRTSACGVASYKSCRTSACGCETYNRGKSCGCDKYKTTTQTKTVQKTCTTKRPSCPSGYKYSSHKVFTCRKGANLSTYTVTCKKTTKTCTQYKRCANAGCETYKSCRARVCGVASYNQCRTSACGVESYKTCWHY